jgi:hypothetical protein
MNQWVLFGYRPYAIRPGIFWVKYENIVLEKNGDKYVLPDGSIYKEDYDNYDDDDNPVYVSYRSVQEKRLMMIVKNIDNGEAAEDFKNSQNKLEEEKNNLYLKRINPDELDIC